MEDVLIVFTESAGKTDECLEALNGVMTDVISRESHFHNATVHVEATSGTVYTIMKWDAAADFVAFLDANQGIMRSALAKYWPKGPLRTVRRFTKV